MIVLWTRIKQSETSLREFLTLENNGNFYLKINFA